jgi:hypothetical protein
MDQTFNFRAAPVPLHRRLSPRAIALVVTACLLLSGLVSFSRWVIDSERRSMARAERADASGAIIGTLSGTDGATEGSYLLADSFAIDAASRADARSAFELARTSASGRATFLDAGPGQLGGLTSSLVFADGPAAAPGVVSVASTTDVWGAAVVGPSGTCYLLRFVAGQGFTYGSAVGGECTGDEALTARDASW